MVTTTLTFQAMDSTEGLKSHIKSKIKKINNHVSQALKIDFILKSEGDKKVAEANTSIFGKTINMTALNENMYDAISEVVNKLDRKLRKVKEKKFH